MSITRPATFLVFLFLGCTVGPRFAAAQDVATVGGVVSSAETGLPLPGVQVFLQDDEGNVILGVVTDLNGEYVFSTTAIGERLLIAQYVGYQRHSQFLRLRSNSINAVDIAMYESPIDLGNVVVSATRERQSRDDVAASIGSVSGVTIEKIRPLHPSAVMNRIAGVWLNMTTGEGHMTSIRQPLSLAPVYLYLENGIPTRSTGFFNHNALYEINVPQAGSIEVIKGPGTALYGSDAIGGVINVESSAPRHDAGADVSFEGGSFGTYRVLGSGGGAVGAGSLELDVNLARSDGWRDGTPYERQSGSIKWHTPLSSRTRLKVLGTVSVVDLKPAGSSGISEDDYNSDPSANYAPISYRNVQAIRLSAAFERFGKSTFSTVTPYVRFNSMNLLPNWSLSFDPSIWDVENYSVGVQVRHRVDLLDGRSRIVTGADIEMSPGSRYEQQIDPEKEGSTYTSYTLGEPVYDYDVTFGQISPYVHAEYAVGPSTRLTGGLRLDLLGYSYENKLSDTQEGSWRRPEDTDVSYTHLSPKLGVTHTFSEAINIFASYRHAFRVPSESQLFRQGAAENTVDLTPVKADQIEVGIRTNLSTLAYLEVSGYLMEKRDDIIAFIQENGARTTINTGRTSHQGLELGAGIMVHPRINLDGNLTWAKHKYDEWQSLSREDYSGNEMEVAPQVIANAILEYQIPVVESASIALEWAHIGSYWMNALNTVKYEGHDVLHLRLSMDLSDRVNASLKIRNVTDVLYAERATYHPFRKDEFAPGLPRSFTIRVGYRIGSR